MKKIVLSIVLIWAGAVINSLASKNLSGAAVAQFAPPGQSSGEALWHLPKFALDGWFLHASNGRVRACNMDKVSVVGQKAGPRCSNWE